MIRFLPLILLVLVIIELRFRPRLSVIKTPHYWDFLLHYSVLDRYNSLSSTRKCKRLFQI